MQFLQVFQLETYFYTRRAMDEAGENDRLVREDKDA